MTKPQFLHPIKM